MRPVVGAAIIRGARVLAARRTEPPELAGLWELPGGKVEPGEPPAVALEREIAEELGCAVEVTGWLDGSVRIDGTWVLSVATARLTDGEPEPVEHDLVRWLAADELGEVRWAEPDRPFLGQVAALLRDAAATPRLRVVLFEADDAVEVRARLRADGFEAEVERERLAGEDDDEDHPWAVVTDAPAIVVELLLDEYDGWLDGEGEEPPAGAPPPPLPTSPRRVKRPS